VVNEKQAFEKVAMIPKHGFLKGFTMVQRRSDRVIGNSIRGHHPCRNEKRANFITPSLSDICCFRVVIYGVYQLRLKGFAVLTS
jgi:hypothetical protein